MVCHNCGKALGNEKSTCPFCGAFLSPDQIQSFVAMKKEKERDLRPKLVSEKYGFDPIKYEMKSAKINNKLIVCLIGAFIFVILFLIILLIIF